mmetsp:Transcript_25391/g.63889  ORF Transcript_25391/g.63889 Transcript_25391/m.63889 type:complete len:200 (+) Transcript_25391:76-675(+)
MAPLLNALAVAIILNPLAILSRFQALVLVAAEVLMTLIAFTVLVTLSVVAPLLNAFAVAVILKPLAVVACLQALVLVAAELLIALIPLAVLLKPSGVSAQRWCCPQAPCGNADLHIQQAGVDDSGGCSRCCHHEGTRDQSERDARAGVLPCLALGQVGALRRGGLHVLPMWHGILEFLHKVALEGRASTDIVSCCGHGA